jgi:hypothetical protein
MLRTSKEEVGIGALMVLTKPYRAQRCLCLLIFAMMAQVVTLFFLTINVSHNKLISCRHPVKRLLFFKIKNKRHEDCKYCAFTVPWTQTIIWI